MEVSIVDHKLKKSGTHAYTLIQIHKHTTTHTHTIDTWANRAMWCIAGTFSFLIIISHDCVHAIGHWTPLESLLATKISNYKYIFGFYWKTENKSTNSSVFSSFGECWLYNAMIFFFLLWRCEPYTRSNSMPTSLLKMSSHHFMLAKRKKFCHKFNDIDRFELNDCDILLLLKILMKFVNFGNFIEIQPSTICLSKFQLTFSFFFFYFSNNPTVHRICEEKPVKQLTSLMRFLFLFVRWW